jgi:hypothetical protein
LIADPGDLNAAETLAGNARQNLDEKNILTKKNARRNEPEGVWQLRTRPEGPAGCVNYFTA